MLAGDRNVKLPLFFLFPYLLLFYLYGLFQAVPKSPFGPDVFAVILEGFVTRVPNESGADEKNTWSW